MTLFRQINKSVFISIFAICLLTPILAIHGGDTFRTDAQTLDVSNNDVSTWNGIIVQARMLDSFTVNDSAFGTGYSIDNLAPGIHPGLLVEPVPGGSHYI